MDPEGLDYGALVDALTEIERGDTCDPALERFLLARKALSRKLWDVYSQKVIHAYGIGEIWCSASLRR